MKYFFLVKLTHTVQKLFMAAREDHDDWPGLLDFKLRKINGLYRLSRQ